MRIPNDNLYECYKKVNEIGIAVLNYNRKQQPSVNFDPLWDNFANWIMAVMAHPHPEPDMPYLPYCVRHGFAQDMSEALAEFISQCNILMETKSPVKFANKNDQVIYKIDYWFGRTTMQVKNVKVYDSKVKVEKSWVTDSQASYHSLVDIDEGKHWVLPSEILQAYAKFESRHIPIDELDKHSKFYFDNALIYI